MLADERKCPTCAEVIKREAIKCRFCGEPVQPLAVTLAASPKPAEASSAASAAPSSKESLKTFKPGCMTWFLVIVAVLIVLAIVGSLLPKPPETSTPGKADSVSDTAPVTQNSSEPTKSEVAATNEKPSVSDLGVKPERLRFNFNQAANLFKTGLYMKKTEVRTTHGVRTFTAQINKDLAVGGTLNAKGLLTTVEFFGEGNGTLVSGANVYIALGQFICAVDPESSGDDRNNIMQQLGLLGDNIDLANLNGSATLHGKSYSSAHTDDVPILIVVAPSN